MSEEHKNDQWHRAHLAGYEDGLDAAAYQYGADVVRKHIQSRPECFAGTSTVAALIRGAIDALLDVNQVGSVVARGITPGAGMPMGRRPQHILAAIETIIEEDCGTMKLKMTPERKYRLLKRGFAIAAVLLLASDCCVSYRERSGGCTGSTRQCPCYHWLVCDYYGGGILCSNCSSLEVA